MARIPNKQAVFFELDGVVMREPRLKADGTIDYYDNALHALSRIDPTRFLLFAASDRTDMALGRMRERDFKKMCERFLEDAAAHDVRIAKIYHCPYHPKGRGKLRKESVFRKPAPGMYKMAQQEFELNLARCWKIGHTTTDILSGSRGGLGTILVQTGEAGQDGAFHVDPHFVEPDLGHAVARINSFERALRC